MEQLSAPDVTYDSAVEIYLGTQRIQVVWRLGHTGALGPRVGQGFGGEFSPLFVRAPKALFSAGFQTSAIQRP